MPFYNVKMVNKETGLSPATLRAWERRYGILKPQRSSGGQRLYSEEEVLLLKWLVARKNEGMSISRAIDLWRNQGSQLSDQLHHSAGLQKEPGDSGDILEKLSKDWTQACLAFNESEAEMAVAKALAISSPMKVCTRVFQRGLAELGAGWYMGSVSVQQEHFASALAARRLNALFAIAPLPSKPGRLLAACPPGEEHDLALMMLSFILRWQGWDVIYLCAIVSLEKLDATLQATRPRLMISAAQTLPAAASLVEMGKVANDLSIPLAFGGGIFNEIEDLPQRIPGIYLGKELDAAPQAIEMLFTHRLAFAEIQPPPSSYSTALQKFKENEALIVSCTGQILRPIPISPRHLEVANTQFTRAMAAALALGDIHLLDYSTEWLNGLLENYGLPAKLAAQYYNAFFQAVQDQIGMQAGPILEWLGGYKSISSGEEGWK
jgi:DNA-binding transcriptional MerR regulator